MIGFWGLDGSARLRMMLALRRAANPRLREAASRSERLTARNRAAAPLSSRPGLRGRGAAWARGENLGARAIREELGPFRPDRAGSVRRRRPRRVSGRGIRRTRTFRQQAELDPRPGDRPDQGRDYRRHPAARTGAAVAPILAGAEPARLKT